jgi:hypothetical protein
MPCVGHIISIDISEVIGGATMGRRVYATLDERFWAKVDRSGGPEACWWWTGYLYPTGYGGIKTFPGDGRKVMAYAHRLSYQLTKGEIPEGREIDHICFNKACVNPAHLQAITHRENILRSDIPAKMHAALRAQGYRRGRSPKPFGIAGFCKHGHMLSVVGVDEHALRNGGVRRKCRECRKIKDRLRYAKKRMQHVAMSTV